MSCSRFLRVFGLGFVVVSFVKPILSQQAMSRIDRGRAEDILHVIAGEVRKHYYDPKFHGVDWDARVAQAKEKIEQSNSFGGAMSQIAAALIDLNDSHTFLVPPEHAFRHDYGFQYQIVGARCFITRVRPNSDAAIKGVTAGDELLSLNGFHVDRNDLWKLQYMFSVLRPQPGLRLELRSPAGAQQQVDVMARVSGNGQVKDLTNGNDVWDLIREEENEEDLMRARYMELGDQLMVLKMPEFFFSDFEVEAMIEKARKHQNLIVDLRGNPGGSVDTLKSLLGGVFDKEVKIADRVGRKETKPEFAKPLHNSYKGKLIVLIDSKSASAAELFARVIQLEKRGTVMGDISSGAVMESRHYNESIGGDTVVFYGASITEWDLIMSDGQSLEHRGVVPDESIIPTAKDLAAGRDPVLAYAAQSLGVKLSADDAGKVFPYEWTTR